MLINERNINLMLKIFNILNITDIQNFIHIVCFR